MKIKIPKSILIPSIKLNAEISDNYISTPYLLCLLIETKDDQIIFTNSNGIISIKNILKNDKIEIVKNGKILVNTKIFFNLINKIENENIIIEKIENSILKIKSENFLSYLNIFNNEIFPEINFYENNLEIYKFDYLIFKKIYNKLKNSILITKEQRNVLKNISFNAKEKEKKIEIVATDGKKMSILEFDWNQKSIRMNLNLELINLITKIETEKNKQITMFYSTSHVIFVYENIKILARLLDIEYPDYSLILEIPKKNEFVFSKKEMQNVLETCNILKEDERKKNIIINFDENNIKIFFKSSTFGSIEQSIKSFKKNEKKIKIILNANDFFYLIKQFDSEKIHIFFYSEEHPVILKDELNTNFTQFIIPLKENSVN